MKENIFYQKNEDKLKNLFYVINYKYKDKLKEVINKTTKMLDKDNLELSNNYHEEIQAFYFTKDFNEYNESLKKLKEDSLHYKKIVNEHIINSFSLAFITFDEEQLLILSETISNNKDILDNVNLEEKAFDLFLHTLDSNKEQAIFIKDNILKNLNDSIIYNFAMYLLNKNLKSIEDAKNQVILMNKDEFGKLVETDYKKKGNTLPYLKHNVYSYVGMIINYQEVNNRKYLLAKSDAKSRRKYRTKKAVSTVFSLIRGVLLLAFVGLLYFAYNEYNNQIYFHTLGEYSIIVAFAALVLLAGLASVILKKRELFPIVSLTLLGIFFYTTYTSGIAEVYQNNNYYQELEVIINMKMISDPFIQDFYQTSAYVGEQMLLFSQITSYFIFIVFSLIIVYFINAVIMIGKKSKFIIFSNLLLTIPALIAGMGLIGYVVFKTNLFPAFFHEERIFQMFLVTTITMYLIFTVIFLMSAVLKSPDFNRVLWFVLVIGIFLLFIRSALIAEETTIGIVISAIILGVMYMFVYIPTLIYQSVLDSLYL